MRQGLSGSIAFLVVDLKTFLDQILRVITNELEFRVVEVVLAVDDLIKDLISRLTLEWQISTHKYVKDDANGPDVTFTVIVSF